MVICSIMEDIDFESFFPFHVIGGLSWFFYISDVMALLLIYGGTVFLSQFMLFSRMFNAKAKVRYLLINETYIVITLFIIILFPLVWR